MVATLVGVPLVGAAAVWLLYRMADQLAPAILPDEPGYARLFVIGAVVMIVDSLLRCAIGASGCPCR